LKVISLSIVLFLIDQVSKLFVRGVSLPLFNINFSGFSPGESRPLIDNLLNITLVENPGIAFGIDPGESFRDLILIITILTCVSFFVYLLLAKQADIKARIAIAFILGGAAGNLFDRIFYGVFYNYAPLFQGNVVDFLDVKIFKFFIFNNIHGNYVFNFADVSILSGVFILIYLIMSSKKRKNLENLVPQVVEDGDKPE
jgi:lipoprotein signal peptidase